jgi:hypothetical protein
MARHSKATSIALAEAGAVIMSALDMSVHEMSVHEMSVHEMSAHEINVLDHDRREARTIIVRVHVGRSVRHRNTGEGRVGVGVVGLPMLEC